MDSNTLQLIKTGPLLEERLGTDIFSSIPKTPGIYRFYDSDDTLLYVGKAKNLRNRLFTYKRAKPGQVSRKVSRLIGRIDHFEIEETDTERNALLLENRWIREERPPFNHANKQTEAYYFIYFRPSETELEFRLAMRIHDETDTDQWYGAFKGHAPVRRSLGCLLQLLWMAEHTVSHPHHLPVQLTRRLTPMRYVMPFSEESVTRFYDVQGMLRRWFLGESCEILDYLMVMVEHGDTPLNRFQTRFMEDRLHHLKNFYDRALTRYRHLRGERRLIPQDELDDLVVEAAFMF